VFKLEFSEAQVIDVEEQDIRLRGHKYQFGQFLLAKSNRYLIIAPSEAVRALHLQRRLHQTEE